MAATDKGKLSVSVDRMEEMMPLIRETLERGQSVTFSPHGISMLPMIRQGIDTVTISPLPERLKKYDIPLYERRKGKYVLHRIVKTGETYTCIGDNQVVFERGLSREQMIGVVTAFTRNGKAHSVNEAGYRLYCSFWHHTRLARRLWRALLRRIKRLFKIK